jgi:hypothetical protein
MTKPMRLVLSIGDWQGGRVPRQINPKLAILPLFNYLGLVGFGTTKELCFFLLYLKRRKEYIMKNKGQFVFSIFNQI